LLNSLLSTLKSRQLEAIEHTQGPQLILAGAEAQARPRPSLRRSHTWSKRKTSTPPGYSPSPSPKKLQGTCANSLPSFLYKPPPSFASPTAATGRRTSVTEGATGCPASSAISSRFYAHKSPLSIDSVLSLVLWYFLWILTRYPFPVFSGSSNMASTPRSPRCSSNSCAV
jgi:hypothetical protein